MITRKRKTAKKVAELNKSRPGREQAQAASRSAKDCAVEKSRQGRVNSNCTERLHQIDALHRMIGQTVAQLASPAINDAVLSALRCKYGEAMAQNVARYLDLDVAFSPAFSARSSDRDGPSACAGAWQDSLALVKESVLEQ